MAERRVNQPHQVCTPRISVAKPFALAVEKLFGVELERQLARRSSLPPFGHRVAPLRHRTNDAASFGHGLVQGDGPGDRQAPTFTLPVTVLDDPRLMAAGEDHP